MPDRRQSTPALKTRPHDGSVEEFVAALPDPQRREECRRLVELMGRVTGEPARMWGPSIVGFGSYHYRYESGREGDWFLVGFSPRARQLSLYLMAGLERHRQILTRLGRHRTGKGCLYVKRLSEADLDVLTELVEAVVAALRDAG
jgi:Domain of unknown function (DU1801)